jgi:hypothetical protein
VVVVARQIQTARLAAVMALVVVVVDMARPLATAGTEKTEL